MSDGQLPLAHRTSDLIGSVIDSSTSVLARQTHDIVRFAMGAPSDDLIPVDLLDEYSARTVPGKYSYGRSEGEPALVEQIVKLQAEHGITTAEERITVTTGGMQGLDLAFKLFVDPGDLVIVEGPTYTNGNATALSYGADVLEAPLDADGLVVDALPALVAKAGRAPKAIYTIPNFQNPSGVTQSLRRREQLLELAARWGSIIVDDDPYGLLRFNDNTIPGYSQIDPGNPQVFSVRTFSKILAPGLRIGWVDSDPRLQQLLINAKQAMDTCTSIPAQLTVTDFLADGHLQPHLERVLGLYRERKDAMRAALHRAFGDAVHATDPDGGFFLWVTFTDSQVDTQALFETALAAGVAYIPGTAFSVNGNFGESLRLCFATSTPERIDEGVARLKRAIDTAETTK
ncbi:PLP-dependent aminotransferase family protein [Mycobacterium sp. 21AC1]|uniref:aminotransferase-like domain-containing protein n=1 Tax=[Mycobacterium] appelbergii TaxID=2939269 RepID=UPI0029390991|nr:PLP-dependent aminotransferase family protein [Mycobacterium sp. 21AC1]MDV3123994.1 PLP-dependent aminotransferase family protein [Mycobacterium sp. 21AC1]